MNWSSKLIHHKKEIRIAVYFEKNAQLIDRIKQFEGAKWSQTLKVWHLPDNENNRIHFKIPEAHLSLRRNFSRPKVQLLAFFQALQHQYNKNIYRSFKVIFYFSPRTSYLRNHESTRHYLQQ